MFTQKFIIIVHSVQEIGLFSLFQDLNLGNASANPKSHLTTSWATSCQYQCICKILSKYSKRFKSYRHFSTFFTNRPASFSLFQNLNLGNASANPKCHFTITWATSCHYQCIFKILSKYSKWSKSYRHFSQTGRCQNLHRLSGDKIKCLIIGHTKKVNWNKKVNFQFTFLRVVQFIYLKAYILRSWSYKRISDGLCVIYQIFWRPE